MPNPIVHWEIQSNQAEKLQGFYRDLFDWHVDTDNPMDYGLVDTHTQTGINGGIGGTNGGPNRVTFYAEVLDLQAFLTRAESLGGKTVMPPMEIPGVVTMALFSDPEGNIIGLVKDSVQEVAEKGGPKTRGPFAGPSKRTQGYPPDRGSFSLPDPLPVWLWHRQGGRSERAGCKAKSCLHAALSSQCTMGQGSDSCKPGQPPQLAACQFATGA